MCRANFLGFFCWTVLSPKEIVCVSRAAPWRWCRQWICPGFETKKVHERTFTGFEGMVRKSPPQKRKHAESNWAKDEDSAVSNLLVVLGVV